MFARLFTKKTRNFIFFPLMTSLAVAIHQEQKQLHYYHRFQKKLNAYLQFTTLFNDNQSPIDALKFDNNEQFHEMIRSTTTCAGNTIFHRVVEDSSSERIVDFISALDRDVASQLAVQVNHAGIVPLVSMIFKNQHLIKNETEFTPVITALFSTTKSLPIKKLTTLLPSDRFCHAIS
jgi:hypothetical protein